MQHGAVVSVVFHLKDGMATVMAKSSVSGAVRTRRMPMSPNDFAYWKNGGLVQNAFPTLTPSDREFLMTGMTDEEWTGIFGPENGKGE